MTLDVARLTEVLTEAILRELGDEVDIVFRYGSFLTGGTTSYSDLDISYVPQHENTWHSITTVVDGVMVDFYPLHWSRLEAMAAFDDVSCGVLLANEVVYSRSSDVAARFATLPSLLRVRQYPATRPEMVEKALGLFRQTGYPYYLLRQAAAGDHLLGAMHQARAILGTVLHALMVVNQSCVDTRKLDQVLALHKLPEDFAETVERVTGATTPGETLAAVETLLATTRALLLDEQREALRSHATFAEVFSGAYPELRGDLQHIMLACDRASLFHLTLPSLYHELMVHMAQALQGVRYTGFNHIAEYEQDLAALNFPPLLPYLVAKDYAGLSQACEAFDTRLRQYLTENGAGLNEFASVADLEAHLAG